MRTIEYKVSFEKMVSRIPGLFAYLESDEFGKVSLHKATDSLNGCWGKVIENIKLPVSLSVEGVVILQNNTVYSYRTIIDYYYQYKGVLEEDNPFIMFIDRGIGKITVPERIKGEATPKYIFLSNAKKIYNELVKMDKMCEFYNQNLTNGLTEKDKHLCCLCERYEQLGGDVFKDYVKTLIPMAETIAQEYKGYAENAQNDGKPMTLDFDVDLVSNYQDFGVTTPYAPIWIPGKRYYKGEKVVYDNELYICKTENTGYFDEGLLTILFDDRNFFEKCDKPKKIFNEDRRVDLNPSGLKIDGQTDSKLVDLRRFVTYYNENNVMEKPSYGYDWLFYYRKGVVVNIRTINDDFGNVKTLDTNQTATSMNDTLAAYGDVIEDITYDTEKNTIKFIYRLGVHLKVGAVYDYNNQQIHQPIENRDDDENKLYKWLRFVWDEDEKIGVRYEEEYTYEEGGDLDRLINGEFVLEGVEEAFSFENYILGIYDKKLPTFKFEFITINNTFNYEKTIAHQNVNISSLLNNFEITRKDFDEFENCDLIREEYLMGISYKPTKDVDVRIQRGSTSAFEKHIAFSEIKTLDDMLTYKNSSFFKLSYG